MTTLSHIKTKSGHRFRHSISALKNTFMPSYAQPGAGVFVWLRGTPAEDSQACRSINTCFLKFLHVCFVSIKLYHPSATRTPQWISDYDEKVNSRLAFCRIHFLSNLILITWTLKGELIRMKDPRGVVPDAAFAKEHSVRASDAQS